MLGVCDERMFPVDANHATICKFSSAESETYGVVGAWVAELIGSARATRTATPTAKAPAPCTFSGH